MVSKVSQSDFGGGLWRSGNRDRVPENASGELQDLLLGEDGLPFERGGATRKSNAALGSSGLLWVWDGWLAAGRTTVFAAAAAASASRLGVDDATPTAILSGSDVPMLTRPVSVGGALVYRVLVGGTNPYLQLYAGSAKVPTSVYSTGTITVTNGSTAVTGAGTAWLANADAGSLLNITPGIGYAVQSIDSDTSLTLAAPYPGSSGAGVTYALRPTLRFTSGADHSYTATAAVVNRLVAVDNHSPRRLVFSEAGQPAYFLADNYHDFPGTILGLAALRDVLLVFTTAGVYAVSNMAYNLIDVAGNPQQRVELVNADLICWGHEGVAPWSGALVVPARDGIWLIDPVSAPQKISLPIDDLYLSYVNAGYKPGVAEVFQGHYFLPVLNGSNVWQDTLVCRLTQSRSGPPFAWSRLRGADAQVAAFAERSGTPLLLAASTLSSSRVLNCTSYFAPAAGVKADSDASTRQAVWESREFALSDMPTTVRRVRVWYELVNPGSGTPTVEFAYAKDSDTGYTVVSNSLGTYQGTGIIAGWENDGTLYNQWPVNKKARGMRFRLRTTGDNAGFKIRQVELVTEQVQNP